MDNSLSLGFSPCPNDTFIFYALVHGVVGAPELDFASPRLADVEQLNQWARTGLLDVTKLSFHALGHLLDDYCLLNAGGALGRGCGPLLVVRNDFSGSLEELGRARIGIPGKLTTASMLLRMFLPECTSPVEMRFEQIMGAVQRGELDGGVIIHESRFTYGDYGLACLQDLGEWWERTTGLPIPLGCIAAKRSLGKEKIARIDRLIRQSVEYAFEHQAECLPYIRSWSQETAPDVVQNHISLYVNDFSRDLGSEGLAAVEKFLQKGREAGALPECGLPLSCHR